MDYCKIKNPKSDSGYTPLHAAASNGHLEVVKLIFNKIKLTGPNENGYDEAGETKSPRDRYGKTALHYAAGGGHFNVCKFLLGNVQEKNPKDVNGKTPTDYAYVNGHLNLLHICEFIPETIRPKTKRKRNQKLLKAKIRKKF